MSVKRSPKPEKQASASRPILDDSDDSDDVEFVETADGDDSPIVTTSRGDEEEDMRVLPPLPRSKRRRVLELSSRGLYRVLKVFRVDPPKGSEEQTPVWYKPSDGKLVRLAPDVAKQFLQVEAIEAA